MDFDEKKMKKDVLQDLINQTKNNELERMGASPKMPEDDMQLPFSEDLGGAQMSDQEMAQADISHPSDEEAQAAIDRMLAEQEGSPSTTPEDMGAPEDQPAPQGQQPEDDVFGFGKGMNEAEKKRKMMEDLFKNR